MLSVWDYGWDCGWGYGWGYEWGYEWGAMGGAMGGARSLLDEELLSDLGARYMLWHELLQETVTVVLGEVRVCAKLDQLTPLPILTVNLLSLVGM
jgi:hypothetical protein